MAHCSWTRAGPSTLGSLTVVSMLCCLASFYPQVWLNYTRKSVTGLSFEYQAYNITGQYAVAAMQKLSCE
jgi:hypothetical protein